MEVEIAEDLNTKTQILQRTFIVNDKVMIALQSEERILKNSEHFSKTVLEPFQENIQVKYNQSAG
jgi:hypothetical protein